MKGIARLSKVGRGKEHCSLPSYGLLQVQIFPFSMLCGKENLIQLLLVLKEYETRFHRLYLEQ